MTVTTRWSWILASRRAGGGAGAGAVDGDRHRARDAGVHEPGTAAGQAAGRTDRCVLARPDDGRDAHRFAALHRQVTAGTHDRSAAQPADAAPEAAPGPRFPKCGRAGTTEGARARSQ